MKTSTVMTATRDLAAFGLSHHARDRMDQRRVSEAELRQALRYGRKVHVRGAVTYVIGRKEVERHLATGLDLSGCEGVHVVVSAEGQTVITTYRNRDFRGLKPGGRPVRRRS